MRQTFGNARQQYSEALSQKPEVRYIPFRFSPSPLIPFSALTH